MRDFFDVLKRVSNRIGMARHVRFGAVAWYAAGHWLRSFGSWPGDLYNGIAPPPAWKIVGRTRVAMLVAALLALLGWDAAAREYPQEVVSLTLEAEQGEIIPPMTIGHDGNASSGRYVSAAPGTGRKMNSNATDGTAAYRFTIPKAGEYVFWGRVRVATNDGSFFARFDDQKPFKWDPWIGGEGWKWIKVFHTEAVHPVYVHLTKGEHVFKLTCREEGMQLDKIVITNDLFAIPGEATPARPHQVVKIWAEAETMELTAPMVRADDPAASGGKYIWTPDTTVAGNRAKARGSAVYKFSISEPGYYLIWGRVLTPPPNRNSFMISVDDSENVFWSLHGAEKAWKWIHFESLRGNVFPLIYKLTAGPHKIAVYHREAGARLDRVLITNDLYFIPE